MTVPLAIHDVRGFINARQKFIGLPRSAIRNMHPINTHGNPKKTPIFEISVAMPVKSANTPAIYAPPPSPAKKR